MKLWHDDVRPPPDDSWKWARNNEAAMTWLGRDDITELSLDHDLGYDGPPAGSPEASADVYLVKGRADETGYDLVKWMCENGKVPPKVTIHSWNPDGAKRMAALLADHGCRAIVAPYQLPASVARDFRRVNA